MPTTPDVVARPAASAALLLLLFLAAAPPNVVRRASSFALPNSPPSSSSSSSSPSSSSLPPLNRSHRRHRAGRRTSLPSLSSSSSSSSSSSPPPPPPPPPPPKVLVLGASGFLGSRIVTRLSELGIPHVGTCTSKTEKSGDLIPLDLTSPTAEDEIASLASGGDFTAVISAVGSIGTKDDEEVNGSTAIAASGAARSSTVRRFVYVGNDPRVRKLSKSVPFLRAYASGKERSEEAVRRHFPNGHAILMPTFIYGGGEAGLNPPRLPDGPGRIAEDVLGLYPVAALSESLPAILGVATEAPVGVERVASAAVNAALGLCGDGGRDLRGREDIVLAACKRPPPEEECLSEPETAECDAELEERRVGLKRKLRGLGPEGGEEAFEIMEELEELRPYATANNPNLCGRWDFVFDVEPDMGTGIIKEMLEGKSPLGFVFDLKDVHMEIVKEDGKSLVKIMVSTKILGQDAELVLTTSLEADASDPYGTMFMERFEGMRLAGLDLPVPESWKRSRPLEFSYLDDEMVVARGNGGEPHFLLRG